MFNIFKNDAIKQNRALKLISLDFTITISYDFSVLSIVKSFGQWMLYLLC